ncbi:MAG: NAD(P)-dependent oxidoreductase, partial [Xanthobacteraceae bacterium]|nr:NAD(P)-dependent oxidoreductase [Xanthobacteraceae bacterium]
MSAASSKGAVGIVGLGIMGGAIARNLAAAGWSVTGYDIETGRCRELAVAGVDIAKDAGELAGRVPTILTSLPHPDALEVTARAIIAAEVSRRVVVEMSTFALDDKMKAENILRKAGHVLLDSPLSGTGSQAKVKDLVVYASGDSASIAALKPLFADFAREAHDLGTFGNGTRMKFVANLLVAINNVATAEAFVLGMKAGLDPHKIFELVKTGAGNSRVFELRGPMMAENRYDGDNVTMKVSTWQKDMAVIGDFAAKLGCPTPLFNATKPVYAAALSNGHEADDTASVCAVLEKMAGLKR